MTTHMDEPAGRRDSVQERHHFSQPQNSSDLAHILEHLLEEGEVAESEIADQRYTQPPPTQNRDIFSVLDTTMKPVSELSAGVQAFIPKNELCFFWYHFGDCKMDPKNPIKNGRVCPYVHSLQEGQDDIQVQSVPRHLHYRPRRLPLCLLNNAEKRKKQAKKVSPEERHVDVNGIPTEHPRSAAAISPGEPIDPKQQKKRKTSIRHRDEPAPGAQKRQRVEYDEEATADGQFDPSGETCFFWYHGHCPRSLDPRVNYCCDRKHALPDPPSMVIPPPGLFIESYACWSGVLAMRRTLPRVAILDRKRLVPAVQTKSTAENPYKRKKQKRERSKAINRDAALDETCFFWYHGTCKRGSEIGERPCHLRHELLDPPEMVKPPPGYVHREPCEREWCPGDAKADAEDDDSNKRYFEDDDVESEVSSDGEVVQEQDWYLTGFDER